MQYIVISIILVALFFLYLLFYGEERAKCCKNFVLYILVVIVGVAVFFQDGVAGYVLSNYEFDGLVTRADAELYTASEFSGVEVMYSWYGVVNFRPVIIVMTRKDGKRRKVVIDSFSGKVLKSGFEPIDENPPSVSEKLFALEQERLRIEAEEKARNEAIRKEAELKAYLDMLARQKLQAELQQTQPTQPTPQIPTQPVISTPVSPVTQPVKKTQTRTRAS